MCLSRKDRGWQKKATEIWIDLLNITFASIFCSHYYGLWLWVRVQLRKWICLKSRKFVFQSLCASSKLTTFQRYPLANAKILLKTQSILFRKSFCRCKTSKLGSNGELVSMRTSLYKYFKLIINKLKLMFAVVVPWNRSSHFKC